MGFYYIYAAHFRFHYQVPNKSDSLKTDEINGCIPFGKLPAWHLKSEYYFKIKELNMELNFRLHLPKTRDVAIPIPSQLDRKFIKDDSYMEDDVKLVNLPTQRSIAESNF